MTDIDATTSLLLFSSRFASSVLLSKILKVGYLGTVVCAKYFMEYSPSWSFSQSRNSYSFTEPGCSLWYSQDPISWSLSRLTLIQCTLSNFFIRSILKLFFLPHLGLRSSFCPSGFPTKTKYVFSSVSCGLHAPPISPSM